MTLVVAWLLSFENRLIYFPTRTLVATPADYGHEFEQINLTSADGTKLMAWAIPFAENAPWLIYFHGNGQNVSHYLPWTIKLHSLGLNVFMLEYRGYGESDGEPSEQAFYQDAEAAYTYLTGRGANPNELILYGYSLGSGVATHLASQHPSAALILEAPYTSVPDVARDVYKAVPTFLMKNRYASKEKIGAITIPVLILHATDDQTIPFAQGKALFERANEPKQFTRLRGGHTALFSASNQEQALETIHRFLYKHQLLSDL